MAFDVKILPSAEDDLEDIVEYLSGFGAQPVRYFLKAYRHQLELLSSGVVDYGLCALPELSALGYHSCRVNAYIMLYYYEDDSVTVAHIFHHKQDYGRLV